MGKYSEFERKPRDFYPTPIEAVYPLIPHLTEQSFYEPCVGDGALVEHLEQHLILCQGKSDIEPKCLGAQIKDARTLIDKRGKVKQFITNPPWDRPVMHAIIANLSAQAPSWFLIDADWAHTKQASGLLMFCSKIVAVGRVKWIPGSKHTGKENCCWYLFGRHPVETKFYGRI